MPDNPTQRRLRAKLAAHTLHSRVSDPVAHTAPARKAFLDRFERQVDPDGTLPPAERARRAEHARKAYFLALALKSAQSRRSRGIASAAKAGLEGARRAGSAPSTSGSPRSVPTALGDTRQLDGGRPS